MPSFARCFVLLAVALSASALTTPHVIRNPHHRRGVAAYISTVDALDIGVTENPLSKRRVRNRRRNGRCKPPTSSSVSTNTTPTTSPAHNNVAGSTPAPPEDETTSTKTTTSKPTTPTSSHNGGGGDGGDGNGNGGDGGSGSGSGGSSGGSGDGPSYMRGTQTGQGTYYGIGLGACGITNKDSDMIVAVSHLLYDTYPGYRLGNPNSNPVCGKSVTATYQGKSVTVSITDRCEGCALTDLDFSPSAFNKIADPTIGRLDGVTWVWN